MLQKIKNVVFIWIESTKQKAIFRCKNCKKRLSQKFTKCPYCGGVKREIEILFMDVFNVKDIFFKVKVKRLGFQKFVYELIKRYKNSVNKRLPEGVYEERIIDKERDLYDQIVYKIKKGKIGRILHKDKEQLSKHKNI